MRPLLQNLDYIGGTTNTAGGLEMARTDILFGPDGPRSGNRPAAPDVVIVMTDGRPNVRPDETLTQSGLLKEQGVRIIALGVTDNVNRTELELMVTDRTTDYLQADDFRSLAVHIPGLVSSACSGKWLYVTMDTMPFVLVLCDICLAKYRHKLYGINV